MPKLEQNLFPEVENDSAHEDVVLSDLSNERLLLQLRSDEVRQLHSQESLPRELRSQPAPLHELVLNGMQPLAPVRGASDETFEIVTNVTRFSGSDQELTGAAAGALRSDTQRGEFSVNSPEQTCSVSDSAHNQTARHNASTCSREPTLRRGSASLASPLAGTALLQASAGQAPTAQPDLHRSQQAGSRMRRSSRSWPRGLAAAGFELFEEDEVFNEESEEGAEEAGFLLAPPVRPFFQPVVRFQAHPRRSYSSSF